MTCNLTAISCVIIIRSGQVHRDAKAFSRLERNNDAMYWSNSVWAPQRSAVIWMTAWCRMSDVWGHAYRRQISWQSSQSDKSLPQMLHCKVCMNRRWYYEVMNICSTTHCAVITICPHIRSQSTRYNNYYENPRTSLHSSAVLTTVSFTWRLQETTKQSPPAHNLSCHDHKSILSPSSHLNILPLHLIHLLQWTVTREQLSHNG